LCVEVAMLWHRERDFHHVDFCFGLCVFLGILLWDTWQACDPLSVQTLCSLAAVIFKLIVMVSLMPMCIHCIGLGAEFCCLALPCFGAYSCLCLYIAAGSQACHYEARPP